MKQKPLLKMLSDGLHRHFPKKDADSLTEKANEIYFVLCSEHKDDPPAVKEHTEGMIYAGVALYRALLEKGMSPQEAFEMTDRIFEDFMEKAAAQIRMILKIPGLYRKVPKIFLTMVAKKYNLASGFKMDLYDFGKDRAKFVVTECPYFNTCKALGCPQLTEIFCNTDDCCYGNMHPMLKWSRTTTIGRGGKVCDFDIMVKK